MQIEVGNQVKDVTIGDTIHTTAGEKMEVLTTYKNVVQAKNLATGESRFVPIVEIIDVVKEVIAKADEVKGLVAWVISIFNRFKAIFKKNA